MSWWDKAKLFVSDRAAASKRIQAEKKARDQKSAQEFRSAIKSGASKAAANQKRIQAAQKKRAEARRKPKPKPTPLQTGSTTPTGAPGMGPQGTDEETAVKQQPTTGIFAPTSPKQAEARAKTTASIQNFGRGVKEALDTPEERKRVATTVVAGVATGAVIASTPVLAPVAAAAGVAYGGFKAYQLARTPKEERAYFLGSSLVTEGAFIGGGFMGAKAAGKRIGKKAAGALSRSEITTPSGTMARSDKGGFISGTQPFKIKYGSKSDRKFAKKFKLPTQGKTEYSQILSGKEGKLDIGGFSTLTTATGPKKKFGLPKQYQTQGVGISGSTPIVSYGKREIRGFGEITKGGIKGQGIGGQRLDRPMKGGKFEAERSYGFGDIKITETAKVKKTGMEVDVFGTAGRKRTTIISDPSPIRIPGKRKIPKKRKDTDISISLGMKPSGGRTPSKGTGSTKTKTQGKTRDQFSTTQITPQTRANLLQTKGLGTTTTSGFAWPSGTKSETKGITTTETKSDIKQIIGSIQEPVRDFKLIQDTKTPIRTSTYTPSSTPTSGGPIFTPPRIPTQGGGRTGRFGGFGFGGGFRGKRFSGKAKYQTVASPTAVFFGIKRTAKQRKQKRFTGLEIIGITNGNGKKTGRRKRQSIL